MNRVIPLTKEAQLEYAIIKAEGENYIIDNKGIEPAVKADMFERNFKTAKLAGIYAFFEGSDAVTKEHMHQALEVVRESSEVLKELRKVKPKHERLLEAIMKESRPITSQGMLAYPFIPSTYTKKINEYIDLARELSSELGYVWQTTSKKGIEYHQVHKPKIKEIKELDDIEKEDNKKVKKKMTNEQMLKFLEE